MSHPFHAYIATQLLTLLSKRRFVVFYDPREEFLPFFDELESTESTQENLPRFLIGDEPVLFARYTGSFFALKAAAEPIMRKNSPEPLILYVPGEQRDRRTSVLMEFEEAGDCYEPQLKKLARIVLRKRLTDGDIDEILAPDNFGYTDIVNVLKQRKGTDASLLKVVLGDGSSEELLAKWLSSQGYDTPLESKGASAELFKLVKARLGFELVPETSLGKARHQVARFVLINEFRHDLTCDSPDSLVVIPTPPGKEEQKRILGLTDILRSRYRDAYSEIADTCEAELSLGELELPPNCLGRIDTFRFEERLLLDYASNLVMEERYDEALALAIARGKSFWVDRDFHRLVQWELLRYLAELGIQIHRIRPSLKKMSSKADDWIGAYAAKDGWYEVDRAQRTLEHWVANMDDEPTMELNHALGLLRRAHETLLKQMAQGFTDALVKSNWSVPSVLHQTKIFSTCVEKAGGRVAYFFVDAMRYEMGTELAELLSETEDLKLAPAVTVLPSITPLGMAALLPEASSSYSVVEHKGKLAARIDGKVMAQLKDRQNFLAARRPESKDLNLGDVLQRSTGALKKSLGDTPLLVVRSQSIDALGEMDGGLLARQIMGTIVGNVARAVRKLGRVGFEYFVIAADHGHQFSLRKDSDMTMEKPGGTKVDQHRRCWAGQGGQTPAACVRVKGTELGYDTDLDFIFPKGLAIFKTGGDPAFHHGGASLQEMVIPVLTLRVPSATKPASAESTTLLLDGYPETLTNRTFGMKVQMQNLSLLASNVVTTRLVLLSEGEEVGGTGMAIDAEFERATGRLTLSPNKSADVAMLLTRDNVKTVRIVALDADTDAVLAQSEEIPVKLGC